MGVLKLEVPEGLTEELNKFPEELSKAALEAIASRAFELRLERSKKMQRAVFELLASKSKLSSKESLELGNKLSQGLLKELEEKKLL